MASVKERAIEVMQHFVNVGTPYVLGGGHDRAYWTQTVVLSDGTVARVPTSTDCSGAVICAYENADPGCMGYAGDTGTIINGCLSTGKWVYHNTSGGEYYMAQPGDLYVYSKALHPSGGHVALCCSAVPDMLIELVPPQAQKRSFYEFGERWDGTLEYIGGGTGSTQIAEDGYWGSDTTKAFQRHYGLTANGLVQHQNAAFVNVNPRLTSGWSCDTTWQGSPVISAIQRNLGVTADGIMGPQTVQAIKELFDGIYGRTDELDAATIWEIQHQLNAGSWPYHLWK